MICSSTEAAANQTEETMAKIAFIGLGNMGGPMAANLAKAQHHVVAFDLSDAAVSAAVEKGAHKASSAAEAVKGAEIVVTMLPAGKHVREVYEKDVLPNVGKGTLLIDCSTIDVESARHVAALAEKAGMDMVDAPRPGPSWKRWARTSFSPAPAAAARRPRSATT
jgi:3-hydroxyisobutyrate dehydrogenase